MAAGRSIREFEMRAVRAATVDSMCHQPASFEGFARTALLLFVLLPEGRAPTFNSLSRARS